MSFRSGALNRVSWSLGGTVAFVTLDQFRMRWSPTDEGHDITSAGHAGQQAIISSIKRGDGDISFHIKVEDYPNDKGIQEQAVGVLKLEFGNRRPHTIPVYISQLTYENETAAGTDYTLRFKYNAEVINLAGNTAAYAVGSTLET